MSPQSRARHAQSRLSTLDREIIAFANAAGGVIYIGVNDSGKLVGVEITNRLKSQIIDIAHHCDPSIHVQIKEFHEEGVLAVYVESGDNKPYRCKDGFFIRNGPSSQKLKRDEIIEMVNRSGKIRFDESIDKRFMYSKDFSEESLNGYMKNCGITLTASVKDILLSLNVVEEKDQQLLFNRAGILFFAKNPQKFLPESYVTCVKYRTNDRFSIIDKKDFLGSPIFQIEQAMGFLLRHMSVEPVIEVGEDKLGARKDVYEFSPVALREAVINAVTHRDYFYDSSHVYVHMFPDFIEIENPGGLFRGLTIENLGKRSVRRNRMIADLLQRAGYIERVGSGFSRMEVALAKNHNPPLEVSATNFFNIRFYKRVRDVNQNQLSVRQRELYFILKERGVLSKREAAFALDVSEDTALRELNSLISMGLICKQGTGRSTVYVI